MRFPMVAFLSGLAELPVVELNGADFTINIIPDVQNKFCCMDPLQQGDRGFTLDRHNIKHNVHFQTNYPVCIH